MYRNISVLLLLWLLLIFIIIIIIIFFFSFSLQSVQIMWPSRRHWSSIFFLNEVVSQWFVKPSNAYKIKWADIYCWKSVRNVCTAKVPYIFSKNFSRNFNVSWTNGVVSFEQPGSVRFFGQQGFFELILLLVREFAAKETKSFLSEDLTPSYSDDYVRHNSFRFWTRV